MVASSSTGGTTPARGQVWNSDQVFPDGEPADFLIISCDEWNGRRVDAVLGMEVVTGHGADDGDRYAPLITVGGWLMTVYADTIWSVPKAGLTDRGLVLDNAALADVDQVLDRALSVASTRPPTAGVPRPGGYPYRGHVRFADLQIPGEKDKPVVVVSSETYGAELKFEVVLACRVTSNPGNVHDFDVVLRSQTGKVVCSDLWTVPVWKLRERTTKAQAVSAKESAEIMAKVRRMVGLS
jgi:mRNA-degrading endonuclease toxin of MazEF toxin-antitoxin module